MKYNVRARALFLSHARCVLVSCFAICSGYSQTAEFDHQIRIHDLPSLTSPSAQASDVLATSLEIVFNNREVCCGRNSALEESVQSSNPASLKDISDKLRGRHLLSDGRAITVTAEFLTPKQVTADHVIYMLRGKHAALMMWNSHLYIVEGVTYVAAPFNGRMSYFLHKLLLLDSRFTDSRREVSIDREKEDSSSVEGLLFLEALQQ